MSQAETPEFPVVPLTGVTELRIHGVSGTPVESMLADPHPVQVWGDGTAGYFRRTAEGNDGTDHLEAYSWGGLTAKSGARAAWLLLLPFMLVNVAAWAHPPRPADRSTAVGTMSGALRVIALGLTSTLVIAAAVLGMDVLAWQCAGAPTECGTKHWYTRWLTTGRVAEPGTRLAIGALLPILVVALIYGLSRSTSNRYEAWGDAQDPPADDPSIPRGVHDLSHPRFWHGGGPVARLRSLHLAGSYATIAGLVGYAASRGDTSKYDWMGTTLTVVAFAVVLITALLLFSPVSGRRRELIEGRPPTRLYCNAVKVIRYGTALALVAALLYAAFLTDRPAAHGAVPGIEGAKDVILNVEWLLVLVLLIANVAARRARDKTTPDSSYRPMLWGYAAPVLTTLGIVLAAAFAAGLTLRVGDYLGCVTRCGPGDGVEFALPWQYQASARSFVFFTVLALVAVLYVLLVARRRARQQAEINVVAEYPGHTDEDRRRVIANTHATAALSDVADGPLLFVLGGTLLTTAVTNELLGDSRAAEWLTHVGTWFIGAFALGLVALGRSAYKSPSLRRTVGILWDLGTFWPRAAHPFAPPCYCERTVPEFVSRIQQLRAGGGEVVVSAHSQGTVIAAAALQQLRGDAGGVALLTYGSPLQRFYARAFPHFFGFPVLGWTRTMLGGRWVNLYRRSDPIGGPVAAADKDVQPDALRPDRRLHDPAFAKPQYAFDWPTSRGHSHYDHDPGYAQSVAALANEVRGG